MPPNEVSQVKDQDSVEHTRSLEPTATAQETSPSEEAGKKLPQNQKQKQLTPERKYPLGATSHCFECGFESSYKIPSMSVSPSLLQHSARVKSATEATKSLRQDIRLVKPRDYVCPSCQTVNYNNRMYCVGCGVMAPWVQEMAKSSPKEIKSIAGKNT
ncbi:hypothetical protein BGX27_002512 [Mortierella sp. AM989]|nr:hypothetical protein BGX27_002512 [Mortierella sp. AM989]